MKAESSANASRPLTGLDLAAMGVNAVVGSSIFLFPGKLAELLGPASIAAFLLTALLLAPVALCFAEAASTRDSAGGPALYAQEAFGPTAGFSIGWLCWVTEIVSFAAVASGLATYAAPFFSFLDGPWASKIVAAAAIGAFGAVNLRGAKPGARVSTTLTVAKLLPLIAIALAGLPLVLKGGISPFAPKGWSGLPKACFLAYFAFQGFEVVPVPAGEVKDPRRAAPLAVLSALALAAVLYAFVQAAALSAVPGLAGSQRPLADAGLALFGPVGERLIAAGALVSMLGFVAGCALGGPRYLVALAEEGHFPAAFARRSPATGAPTAAVLWTAGVSACVALAMNFDSLIDFGNVVIGAQYLATCAAVLVERGRGRVSGFRAPGGPLVPVAGLAATIWLGAQGGGAQLAAAAVVLGAGFAVRRLTRAAVKG
ncbi:MAG: amino acid permease [Elusimicrobia bacterium]|nr:amino acid permease [Elusimicrobiota bacterium]